MNAIEQATAYEPIFYHDPTERWVPVHPVKYLSAANLWLAHSRVESRRKDPSNWGRCRIPVPPNVPTTFEQGKPLIARGNISTNAADEQADYAENFTGPIYLGHDETPGTRATDCCDRQFPYTETNSQCENFLDVAGWAARPDVATTSPNSNDYIAPGVTNAFNIWTSAAHTNDLDAAFVEVVDANGVLSDEVLNALKTRFKVDGLRLFLYYALYPMHEEKGLGSTRADYEGDWTCVAVLAPPADAAATAAPPAVAYCYGSRKRTGPNGVSFRVRFVDDFTVNALTGHPKAYVASGTHNLHSQPGGDPPKAAEDASDKIDDIVDKANSALDDLDTTRDTVVVITKVVAGAAIGGLIGGVVGAVVGAVVGGIAGAIEAATNDPPQIDIGGKGPAGGGGTGKGGDVVPDTAFGLILSPQSVLATVPEAGAATAVRRWRDDLPQRAVDRPTQPWWADSEALPDAGAHAAYAGRWGVLCTSDRLDRVSGMPFPDYLLALDENLLIELSDDASA